MHEELLWSRLQDELARAVADFAGVAGVAILDLMSGKEIGIHADELFPTASTIKIHILTQLLLRAERGAGRVAAATVYCGDHEQICVGHAPRA